MRTFFMSAALVLLVGCASQGDVLESRSNQMVMSGDLELMKRDTKAALDRIEELNRQIQRSLKDNEDKLEKILEAVKERQVPPPTPGQKPPPLP
jgi:uncharacterized membrane protein